MDLLTAGILAGGSALATGANAAVSGKMNKRARKTALEMQQIGNDFNMQEAEKARSWQERMINESNAYNDPSAERERLEAAGYNAALMADSGNIGFGSANPSGSPQASAVSPGLPQQQAINLDFSGVQDAINSYYSNKKIASETRGVDIANRLTDQFGSDQMKAEIARNLGMDFSQVDGKKFSTVLSDPFAVIQRQDYRVKELEGMAIDNQLRFSQSLSTFADVYSKGIINKYLDKSTKADLDIKVAEIANIASQTAKNRQEIDNLVKQGIESTLRSEGLRLDNKQLRGIQEAYIRAMNESNAYEAEFKRKMRDYVDSEARWSHDVKRNAWLKDRYDFEDYYTKATRFSRKYFWNPFGASPGSFFQSFFGSGRK